MIIKQNIETCAFYVFFRALLKFTFVWSLFALHTTIDQMKGRGYAKQYGRR